MTQASPAPAYAAEYAQRMNRVLDHIDRHLDAPLELSVLAEVAHFSPFHFHRVFAAWMGETLGDYLRRRRLDIAALRLASQAQARVPASVLEIALAVGFGSGEAFARAFKQRFGCTPSAWRAATPQRWAGELAAMHQRRRHSNPDQDMRNPDQPAEPAFTKDAGSLPPESSMQVKVLTLPPARVAYMRHIGPYGAGVARLWREVFMPWRAAQGLEQAPCYGIGHDDPSVTDPDKCRYDACVEVPDSFVAQNPVGIATLPGGRYAVADYYGTGAGLSVPWTQLLRDWLPASGMRADSRPHFEYLPVDTRYDPRTGEFGCQLCLPVRPL
ncbi:GyrI-like domain-containing protein [Xylophilus sp. GW821-FHT01B05]